MIIFLYFEGQYEAGPEIEVCSNVKLRQPDKQLA